MHQPNYPRLSFGISLAPGYPYLEIVSQAKKVEALGFDHLWLPDHFVNPQFPGNDWFECWTLLAAIAAQTNTIRIGTLVSSMTLRNPALLARQALTLDHVSSGRLELGVGAAGVRHCHEMTGVPFWERRERAARFREWVTILASMLERESTSYSGNFYSVNNAQMHPRPLQGSRPPLNIAAHGDKALRLAAEFGDGWNSYSPGRKLTPAEAIRVTAERNARLSSFAEEIGRNPADIRRLFLFGWTADRPFASREAWFDAVGRYSEAGIREFVFFYVPGLEAWQGQSIISEESLEELAGDMIPAARRSAIRNPARPQHPRRRRGGAVS